jgi:biotin operon repressor
VLLYVTLSGPVTIADIARDLGLPRREVEQAIQSLRLQGNPIATGQDGVRLARTADELAESNRSLHHRLVQQYQTLRAQRRAEARLRAGESDLTLGLLA